MLEPKGKLHPSQQPTGKTTHPGSQQPTGKTTPPASQQPSLQVKLHLQGPDSQRDTINFILKLL